MVDVLYRSEWNFRGIPLLGLMLRGQVSWFLGGHILRMCPVW